MITRIISVPETLPLSVLNDVEFTIDVEGDIVDAAVDGRCVVLAAVDIHTNDNASITKVCQFITDLSWIDCRSYTVIHCRS